MNVPLVVPLATLLIWGPWVRGPLELQRVVHGDNLGLEHPVRGEVDTVTW